MENELETAKLVQKLYFPQGAFEHPSLTLAGTCVPASECSGDWWHYAKIGDHLVVVIGDATGHGASAALVTSAAHATFTAWAAEVGKRKLTDSMLAELAERLNLAVFFGGGGSVLMTAFLSAIDLSTGLMKWMNFAHPAPVVYSRATSDSNARVISGELHPMLGSSETITLKMGTMQLQPKDQLFWFTDGILDQRNSDQARISKPKLMKKLAESADKRQGNAPAICRNVIDDAVAFFGTDAAERPDDITVVVASAAPEATFGTQRLTAAEQRHAGPA